MQRVTITLEAELAAAIDRYAAAHGYGSRSEAVRDLARAALRADADPGAGDCVAALVYAYRHDVRQLARRLTQLFHEHHDVTRSSLHVHLDHESCLEIAVLEGPLPAVRHLADLVTAQRGVQYGHLVIVPVIVGTGMHRHGGGARPHAHTRIAPA